MNEWHARLREAARGAAGGRHRARNAFPHPQRTAQASFVRHRRPDRGSTAKRVWAWTLEERISARTNAAAARERVRAAARGKAASMSTPGSELSSPVDSFDGKAHPEWFLPHEVFRTLITHAFLGTARGGQLFRQGLLPEIERDGLPADFWQRLESISTVYVADTFGEIDIGAGLQTQNGTARNRASEALAMKQRELG